MSRSWLVPCFLLWTGCSDGPVRSGFLERESEPTLLLRCQEGRVTAYISLTPPEELEAGAIPDDAVPVELDSTPAC